MQLDRNDVELYNLIYKRDRNIQRSCKRPSKRKSNHHSSERIKENDLQSNSKIDRKDKGIKYYEKN